MRHWLFLIILILLCSRSVHANACTAQATGNWNTPGTWTTCGGVVPGTGDTATIPAGKAVTCSDAESVGTSASSNTAIAITGTGQLLLVDSCVLSVKGNITMDAAGNTLKCTVTTTAATLQFVVPLTFNYTLSSSANGSANVFNWSGLSNAQPCTITTTTGGGTAQVAVSNGPVGTVTVNNAVFSNLGTATTNGFQFNMSNSTSVSIQHALFDNSGATLFSFFGSTIGYTMNALDWRRCLDTNNNYCWTLAGSANPSVAGTRLITNITGGSVSLGTTLWAVDLEQPGLNVGKSKLYGDTVDTPGFHGYNVWLNVGNTNNTGTIVRSSYSVNDVWTSARNYQMDGGSNEKLQDSIALMQGQNQHEIGTSGATNTTANTYQGIVIDGNGMTWTDTGDAIADSYTYNAINNLCINEAGAALTQPGSSVATGSWLNNTMFNCNNVSTVGGSLAFTALRNNLFVYPGWFGTSAANANGGAGEAGINQSEPTWNGRYSSMSLDYNTFWMMPASGDSMRIGPIVQSARASCPSQFYCLLTHPVLSTFSYVGVPGSSTTTIMGSKAINNTSTSTSIVCTTAPCTFTTAGNGMTAQAGDYVCDVTASPKTCAPISSVTDATHLILVSPGISTLNGTTNSIQVRAGYQSTAGQFYGSTSGYGDHDKHIDPRFIDASRTSCTWYTFVSGASSECNAVGTNASGIPNSFGMIFSVSSTPDTTHIVCSTCSFTSWGLIAGTTIVQDSVNGGPTVRGRAVIQTIVDATHITLATAIPGLAANDSFTFVTATQGIGRGLLTLNGWDYGSGSSGGSNTPVNVTPVAWANAQSELAYLRLGFTPMNGQLKNAASPTDCVNANPATCDPGAVAVFSSPAMSIF